MSDHESSYYEIALTHRQVVVSFVVLLGFVLAVFLCGVWVGKNAGPEGSDPRIRTRMADSDGTAAPGDLSQVEEFTFPDQGEGTAGGDEQLETPDLSSLMGDSRPDTTLAQDLGRETPPPPPRPQQAPRQPATTTPPASPTSSPQASDPPPPSTQSAPPPPTRPPPANSPEGPLEPTSVTPGPTPTPAGQEPTAGFVVQVFSGRDEDQAKKVVQTLEGDGYEAYLSPVKVGAQMRYRVRIGPYDSRVEAEQTERVVRQKYRYETWVTTADN